MLTIPILQISNLARRLCVLAALTLLGACAATPNANLRQAQHVYNEARMNSTITTHAPVFLHEAAKSLRQAEQADDEDDINHFAYIAHRQVQIAEAEAQRKSDEAEAERRIDQRDRSLLESRTREAQEAQALAGELAQELAQLKAIQTERGFVINLGDVLFGYNRDTVNAGGRQTLDRLAEFLYAHPEQTILIEGHTDGTGTASYNLDLSDRRARAVERFLVGRGISPRRITARGYGEAHPVASDDTDAGRQQNRRVEVVLPQTGIETGNTGPAIHPITR